MTIQLEKSHLIAYGLPLLIILSSVLLALSPLTSQYPALAMGVTYDLTIIAPLVYFLLIRKKNIPKITVMPFFVLGVLLASILLPATQKYHLIIVSTYLLPLVELVITTFTFYTVYKTLKASKEKAAGVYDFYFILKQSAINVMGHPRIAKIFASEIAMVYYAFFAWKQVKEPENGFTNFKENGATALLGVITFMTITETFIVHLLVANWNETLAWVLTCSSIYLAIQILAHIKALKRRFSELRKNELILKNGLFGDMQIDLTKISRVELMANTVEDEHTKVHQLALLPGIESHNIAIYFTEKQKIEKIYGITQACDVLLLHIDHKQDFVEKLRKAINGLQRSVVL